MFTFRFFHILRSFVPPFLAHYRHAKIFVRPKPAKIVQRFTIFFGMHARIFLKMLLFYLIYAQFWVWYTHTHTHSHTNVQGGWAYGPAFGHSNFDAWCMMHGWCMMHDACIMQDHIKCIFKFLKVLTLSRKCTHCSERVRTMFWAICTLFGNEAHIVIFSIPAHMQHACTGITSNLL